MRTSSASALLVTQSDPSASTDAQGASVALITALGLVGVPATAAPAARRMTTATSAGVRIRPPPLHSSTSQQITASSYYLRACDVALPLRAPAHRARRSVARPVRRRGARARAETR